MAIKSIRRYFGYSLIFHVFVLSLFILGLDLSAPLPVFENSHHQDVISAIVLGDTPDSKIATREALPQVIPKSPVKREALPIKAAPVHRADVTKKLNEKIANDLLTDIKKVNSKKNRELQAQFKKTLREQAEKSLRQQLLDEEIKFQAQESRAAEGVVNQYKALILQAISEHWIIPTQTNKKLTCELMIHLAPGGTVLTVQVIRTSGDVPLDNSARAAVLKASPLPVPKEPQLFASFRQFVLKVKPENVLASKGR
jgi:colicin import membrane protein